MYNILICDDEKDIVNALKIYLSDPDYTLFEAYNGKEAVDILEHEEIDLILLDIMMPGMDGITATAKIREFSNVPIIFLTAKSETEGMVLGLNVGADDYITKPYTVRNVVARVKSVLRRTSAKKNSNPVAEKRNVLQVDGLVLDLEFKRCMVDGVEVKMAKKEFEILAYLISHRGTICSREQILGKVWKNEVVVLDRTIDVNITRVRNKIGAYGSYIVTRSGYGYGFRD